ncbi:lipoprotein NlpI [Gallaecimonas sp. GXIMD4217]|uniref:lipoprotein NlpI n=1 Tax=Gallaecimonas sp. GXIMD4217 TaxID=3131927 RepID=UPI00311AC207
MRKALILFLSLAALGGCAVSPDKENGGAGKLILAEPVSVPFQAEVELARLEEILYKAELSQEQQAQLLYRRGVILDSVGLKALARRDFNRAIQLKPDLADAYNFVGIHAIAEEEFDQAYEALDAAIELQPGHDYAYLNRGIALYYGGRPTLAVRDFEEFLNRQPDDPYRLLWLFLAEQEINRPEALARLAYNASRLAPDVWGNQIVALYLGRITKARFVAGLTEGVSSNKELAERLCEAYFYLGKLHQFFGQEEQAINYFKLALTTNVQDFIEHRYARLELKRLRQARAARKEAERKALEAAQAG